MGAALNQPFLIQLHGMNSVGAVRVGRRNWIHVFKDGPFSLFEMSWRVVMLWANLRQHRGDHLCTSEAFNALAHWILRRGLDCLLVYPGGEILKAVTDATARIANVAWTGPMLPPAFQGARLDVQEIGRLGLCEKWLFDWERRRAGVI
jgi:hypothetical protein